MPCRDEHMFLCGGKLRCGGGHLSCDRCRCGALYLYGDEDRGVDVNRWSGWIQMLLAGLPDVICLD